jgi:YidB-like protein
VSVDQILGGLLGGSGRGGAGGGDLGAILGGFRAKGLSSEADSWVGPGENAPVSGGQMREVLGDDQVAEVAQQAGVSEDEAAEGMGAPPAGPRGQRQPRRRARTPRERRQRVRSAAAVRRLGLTRQISPRNVSQTPTRPLW